MEATTASFLISSSPPPATNPVAGHFPFAFAFTLELELGEVELELTRGVPDAKGGRGCEAK